MKDITPTPKILINPTDATRRTSCYKKVYDKWDCFMRGVGRGAGTVQPKPLPPSKESRLATWVNKYARTVGDLNRPYPPIVHLILFGEEPIVDNFSRGLLFLLLLALLGIAWGIGW